jgi:hypothetical protein
MTLFFTTSRSRLYEPLGVETRTVTRCRVRGEVAETFGLQPEPVALLESDHVEAVGSQYSIETIDTTDAGQPTVVAAGWITSR